MPVRIGKVFYLNWLPFVMALTNLTNQFRYFTALTIVTFSLVITPTVSNAKLFDGPVDKLDLQDRVALRQGQVILSGEKGEYVCRILVNGSIDNAWDVLTDYDNFDSFLPGVADSQLVQNEGKYKVFEQINKIKTFIFSKEARIRLAVTESYPQKIAFDIVDGDLNNLNGTWLLEPVSPYPSAPPNQVLITHQVKVEPNNAPGRGIFFQIYENTLAQTLSAIKTEVEERYPN